MKKTNVSVLKSNDAIVYVTTVDGEYYEVHFTEESSYCGDHEISVFDGEGELVDDCDPNYQYIIKTASDELFAVAVTELRRYDCNGAWTHDTDLKLGDYTPPENSMWRVYRKYYKH